MKVKAGHEISWGPDEVAVFTRDVIYMMTIPPAERLKERVTTRKAISDWGATISQQDNFNVRTLNGPGRALVFREGQDITVEYKSEADIENETRGYQ